jgi:hypothetical protein
MYTRHWKSFAYRTLNPLLYFLIVHSADGENLFIDKILILSSWKLISIQYSQNSEIFLERDTFSTQVVWHSVVRFNLTLFREERNVLLIPWLYSLYVFLLFSLEIYIGADFMFQHISVIYLSFPLIFHTSAFCFMTEFDFILFLSPIIITFF